jgi:hypothetical protein
MKKIKILILRICDMWLSRGRVAEKWYLRGLNDGAKLAGKFTEEQDERPMYGSV